MLSWRQIVEWLFWVFVGWWALLGSAGCGIVNTGPKVATATVEAATGVAKLLAAQFEPEQMRAGVEFDIHDPRYFTKVFVGTGVLCTIDMGLNGVDTSVDISGSGRGGQIPLEVKTQLIAIMGNHALSEEQRRTAIVEAIMGWLAKPETREPIPGDDVSLTPIAPLDPTAEYAVIVTRGRVEERLLFRGDEPIPSPE